MYRIVIDTNLFISYAIGPKSNSAVSSLVRLVLAGKVELVVSNHLLDELETRLARDKFRKYFTVDQAQALVDAVTLVGTFVDDRPDDALPQVCTDPDDNFLAALAYDSDANMLVSGDKAVRNIKYANVSVYNAADALDSLGFVHEWGDGFLKGSIEDAERQIDVEGNRKIIEAYRAFRQVIDEDDAAALLPFIVVPGTVKHFIKGLDAIRVMLANRGMGTRPIYASPDVAYIKLPPDPGVLIRATKGFVLPDDTILVTMQRCPTVPDAVGCDFDHWRVFGVGGSVEPERIRRLSSSS